MVVCAWVFERLRYVAPPLCSVSAVLPNFGSRELPVPARASDLQSSHVIEREMVIDCVQRHNEPKWRTACGKMR
jgi:hypothetical protein